MLYMKSSDGALRVIVLESANLENLRAGLPAKTPDGEILIAWTPDPVWLADRVMGTDGDAEAIARLIEEAAKRPEKAAPRPKHGTHVHHFDNGQ